ncbi:hypothetical protein [Halomonas sp. BC04]|uniref:hypothetical protein n=1 Tax=Halomonas sp. BC04 TaxID=1403540 RepID=UPI0003ED6AA5|nr:hypothetical protein [Halomonas sp. BC04]EWH00457.1 hypothetical protein Q427_19335 [Halomonas sp. BC04]
MSRLPRFPTQEHFITHTRAVLAMLLRGDGCDQYSYHRLTGLPLSDFRTRVSELYRAGWPIDREFHQTLDTNGEPRRCKHYWLNAEEMAGYFAAAPVFRVRCKAFEEKHGGGPCHTN